MTQFAKVSTLGALSPAVAYVEAASPEDLQNKINTVLSLVDSALFGVTAITLAGGGDGHTFVALIETAPVANINGTPLFGTVSGVQSTVVRCYLAGSEDELVPARLRAGAPDSFTVGQLTFTWGIVDEQFAGASKGTRFMGMTVYAVSSLNPINNASPLALAFARPDTPQVLAGGSNIVLFGGLAPTPIQFSLPAAGAVQYDGGLSVIAKFFATAAVEQDAPGDVTVQIVRDPNGAATVIEQMLTHITTAGEYDTVAVYGYALLTPKSFSVPNAQFGLNIVAAGAGLLKSAQLMIAQ
jgi:hypothetical protein